MEHDAYHSTPSTDEVQNTWNYSSSPPPTPMYIIGIVMNVKFWNFTLLKDNLILCTHMNQEMITLYSY